MILLGTPCPPPPSTSTPTHNTHPRTIPARLPAAQLVRDIKVEDKFFLTPPDFQRESVEVFTVGDAGRYAQVKVSAC